MIKTDLDIKLLIRDVPDFPKPGILFKDITPVLQDPAAFQSCVEHMAAPYRNAGISSVVCVEARGYIFGSAIAAMLGCGFVPVRKKGKLPSATYEVTYALEYGEDTLAIHRDAVKDGDKVLIVDDLLATGGTVAATVNLLTNFNMQIAAIVFLIELTFLNGRQKLPGQHIHSVIQY